MEKFLNSMRTNIWEKDAVFDRIYLGRIRELSRSWIDNMKDAEKYKAEVVNRIPKALLK